MQAEEQRPLVYRIGKDEVPLWPEERAMLRDFATLGTYPTAYTQTMQDLKVAGVFSRLEECGPNGTAVVTDFGRELFKRIGAPLASAIEARAALHQEGIEEGSHPPTM